MYCFEAISQTTKFGVCLLNFDEFYKKIKQTVYKTTKTPTFTPKSTVHTSFKTKKRMIKELKSFLLRGDVVTLAVAVIIGGAFQKIVDSMVVDVITPILGMITGNPDFSGIVLGGKAGADGKIEGGIMIGKFINAIVSFLMVGIVLFFVVKAAGKKAEDAK
jgi:large conductance mechanosensitive channel